MFGNELTDQQRQASLTQSIFAGLPFVPGMAKEANRIGQQAINSTVQIDKQGADVSRAFMMILDGVLIHRLMQHLRVG